MAKKSKLPKVLLSGAVLCGLAFGIALVVDLNTYQNHPEYSAAFSAYVLVRAVEFLLPGIVLLLLGIMIQKKMGVSSGDDLS